MALLVGLPADLFTNRSGRTTLITRLAAKGVPNEVRMLLSGHHTSGGYQRYDRTQTLKMEAAALVSSNPALDYQKALTHVNKHFVEEKVVGSTSGLQPLIDRMTRSNNLQMLSMDHMEVSRKGKEKCNEGQGVQSVKELIGKMTEPDTDAAKWDNNEYDKINWVEEIQKLDPILHQKMFGPIRSQVSVGNNVAGNYFHNCIVTIKIVEPDAEKEN